MRLLVGVVTLAHPQFTYDCVGSALDQVGVEPKDVLVICNGSRVRDACENLQRQAPIDVLYPGTNLGVSVSWNLIIRQAMERGYDGAYILGDDVRFVTHDGFLVMRYEAEKTPDRFFTTVGIGFGSFCVMRSVWEKTQGFDEGFWPAYYEDNDFHLRARRAGVETLDVPIEMSHVGSGSLKMFPEWEQWNARVAFPVNQKRYVQKWGGLPEGREMFEVPWNGGEGWSSYYMLKDHPGMPAW